ncbi:MAG TPA: lipopolysaccharide kinase InaA family protein [Kiritimatiellia bacterium]|jgi:tRNA A-37 threonylcarbamoyl transferase component Bud32|nr:lipopolysaccharide kinase InaA family protein [Kiritimatiellia bacterium]HOU58560.1 lipopolysaccharide kinase InaA family protein [Kiritimatiellia bacterium]HQK43902.1 lipopolysaccharide kinase InaA family protein [Kiritimatiellia bacterium]HQM22457.1 lipopolysaccharide kinase InaA family protein [Kiritimatiellia bacterium]
MTDPVWQSRGARRFLVAPGWDHPDSLPTLDQLPYLVEKEGAPLVPPGRHRVDRLTLPLGGGAVDAVVKTYAPQAAWRDRLARRAGSKAERAFRTALALQQAGVGTPAPLAVVERWEGARLRECRFVARHEPDLTNLRDELNRIYAHAPLCAPLMDLLQDVADAVRALHDAGILHRDLGNQNIALRPTPNATRPWQVLFLDLNRAAHAANPTPAQRGADLARLDLPSDFRRVFHAMYFHGYAPPAEFARAEQRTRAAFARHTALRPLRHPCREARIRREKAAQPQPLRGREIWIWDDRSAQAIPAYTPRDRRKLLPAANVVAALHSAVVKGWPIQREYRRLRQESFTRPVPFANAIGMTLEPEPDTWDRQLEWLAQLQGGHPMPLLLRLYHHQGPAAWQWTLDQARHLHRQGHLVSLALVQDRRAIRDPKGWRQMVSMAFDRAHSYADFFEVGHAINRAKWGVWDFREYRQLLQPVHACSIQYPEAKITGPACIDFEPYVLGALLGGIPAEQRPHALSHHLYVDRRGAPENPQGPFDTVAKCALLRAYARAYGLTEDRILISEVNWPLLGTGVWSPVNSPYETRDPRQNDPSVSEADYAAFMARYLLLTLASGHVSRVYWWRLAARGFGLIDDTDPAAWRPRPAFNLLQTMLAQLDGATFGRRLDTPPGDYALEFTRPAAPPLTVRWSPATAPTFQ